jgi:hypothetical protein
MARSVYVYVAQIMKAENSSETSVEYHTTRCHNPGENRLQILFPAERRAYKGFSTPRPTLTLSYQLAGGHVINNLCGNLKKTQLTYCRKHFNIQSCSLITFNKCDLLFVLTVPVTSITSYTERYNSLQRDSHLEVHHLQHKSLISGLVQRMRT